MMDCQTARLLFGFSPTSRELAGTEGDALENHLAACAECGQLAQSERRFHAHMSQAMSQVAVPEGLQLRILARLKVERGDAIRRWVGRGTRAALAAAALILVSWFAYTFWQKPPATLDLDLIHNNMVVDLNSPSKERVEQWFAQTHHVAIQAPPQFDYAWLTHFDLAEFEGKRVPMLLFVRDQVAARVYIITAKDFNFANLPDSSNKISSSGITVEVRHAPGTEYAYVIVYKGDSLDPVLEKTEVPAA
jgi:hypothetical protein